MLVPRFPGDISTGVFALVVTIEVDFDTTGLLTTLKEPQTDLATGALFQHSASLARIVPGLIVSDPLKRRSPNNIAETSRVEFLKARPGRTLHLG